MRSPGELRNDAMDCLRLADEAKAPHQKSLFLMMAQAWNLLAEQAEDIDAPKDLDAAGAEPNKQSKPH